MFFLQLVCIFTISMFFLQMVCFLHLCIYYMVIIKYLKEGNMGVNIELYFKNESKKKLTDENTKGINK